MNWPLEVCVFFTISRQSLWATPGGLSLTRWRNRGRSCASYLLANMWFLKVRLGMELSPQRSPVHVFCACITCFFGTARIYNKNLTHSSYLFFIFFLLFSDLRPANVKSLFWSSCPIQPLFFSSTAFISSFPNWQLIQQWQKFILHRLALHVHPPQPPFTRIRLEQHNKTVEIKRK